MKRITSLLAVITIVGIIAAPTAVFAANATVSIEGKATVQKGKMVTYKVFYKGKSLGVAKGQLEYDSNKLQYVSGGSSVGNAGLVQLSAWSSSNLKGQIVFTIKFKAVESGEVSLNVNTLETSNINQDKSMGTPSTQKMVKITDGKTTGDQETIESEAETQPTEMTETSEAPTYDDPSAESEETKERKTGGPVLWSVVGVLLAGSIALIIWRLKKSQ